MRDIDAAVAQFRLAAIQKAEIAAAPDDHRLHQLMADAVYDLEVMGEPGRAALRHLLEDESPFVRSWIATHLLAVGDASARGVLEALSTQPGLLGFGARVTLREYEAGRLTSPF
jgi:hypothetical protein